MQQSLNCSLCDPQCFLHSVVHNAAGLALDVTRFAFFIDFSPACCLLFSTVVPDAGLALNVTRTAFYIWLTFLHRVV